MGQGRGHWWTTLDSVLCVTPDSLFNMGADGGVTWRAGLPELGPVFDYDQHLKLSHVLRTANGNIVVGGRKYLTFMSGSPLYSRTWLGVYSNFGALVDSVTIGTPSSINYGLKGLDLSDNGGFLAYGLYSTAIPYWIRGSADAGLSVLLWNNVVRTEEVRDLFRVSAAALRPNGNIVTVGHVGDFVNADEDRAIMEINSTDSVICYRLLNSAVSGYGPPHDLALTQEGHTVFVGADDRDQNVEWGNCLNWTAIDVICESTTSIAATSSDAITVSPQPSSGVFRLQGMKGVAHKVVVLDARGITVQEISIRATELRIDLTGHAPGLYHAHITSADGKISSHPLLLVE